VRRSVGVEAAAEHRRAHVDRRDLGRSDRSRCNGRRRGLLRCAEELVEPAVATINSYVEVGVIHNQAIVVVIILHCDLHIVRSS
tara:strand:+ start:2109 stop:2360 length:252 start_codon:yes stop_codon:yes gene_type:complete